MNEFKGTPGPWFGDNSRAIGPKSTEDDQSYGMIIPVGWVEFDPEVEVQVANQRMMAAAPELLEALEMLVVFTTPTKRNAAALSKAYAAIAKAIGESQ